MPKAKTSQPRYVVKPTPATYFTYRGLGAREMNWGRVSAANKLIPNAHFYIHNRTPPPAVDIATWKLTVSGSALPQPCSFTYDDLRALPAVTIVRALECGSNGRRFFPKVAPAGSGTTWLPVAGSEWRFGAIGAATWTGVRLADVLQAAGANQSTAVDVQFTGLDSDQYSHVIPAAKAYADDSLLVYGMNGRPLPIDHGFPCRAFLSGWGGNASVKWLGSIVVSTTALPLPPPQQAQRLVGPDYPQPQVVTVQNVKSAFELDWEATLTLPPNGAPIELSGRAWSGAGKITGVEVSVRMLEQSGEWQPVWDPEWRTATLDPSSPADAWTRFTIDWPAPATGYYELMARATDAQGSVQPEPDAVPWNQYGLLYNGHIGHPVSVVPPRSAG